MSSDYTFNFTDTTIDSLYVPAYHIDGPINPTTAIAVDHISNNVHYPLTSTSPSTTLVLVGKGVPEYGQIIQQNLIYMLEHFADIIAPIKPVIGQLWFNKQTNTLNIYNQNANWSPLLDGTGGVVSGSIFLTGDITLNQHVPNKGYVDAAIHTATAPLHIGQITSNYDTSTGTLLTQIGGSSNSTTTHIPPVSDLSISTQYDAINTVLTITLSNSHSAAVYLPRPSPPITKVKVTSIGEQTYTIPTYVVGSNRLWIFVNGVKQSVDDDYIETNNVTVTFITPQTVGLKLEFLYI